mmetsp:Transcript_12746/g.19103  ORF Transcript_12746/g.19103 Transcript_12746/m.19103 type:complete len:100 (-) Transcript_12746:56-355(-)
MQCMGQNVRMGRNRWEQNAFDCAKDSNLDIFGCGTYWCIRCVNSNWQNVCMLQSVRVFLSDEVGECISQRNNTEGGNRIYTTQIQAYTFKGKNNFLKKE